MRRAFPGRSPDYVAAACASERSFQYGWSARSYRPAAATNPSRAVAGSPSAMATLAEADAAIARQAELSNMPATLEAAPAYVRAPSRSSSCVSASAATGFSSALQLGQSP